MGTVIQETHQGNENRRQRWAHLERADLFAHMVRGKRRAAPSGKRLRCLTCPAARGKRGGRTKTAWLRVPLSWPFFTVFPARLPVSAGPGVTPYPRQFGGGGGIQLCAVRSTQFGAGKSACCGSQDGMAPLQISRTPADK